MPVLTADNWCAGAVRVRASAPDPYAGLRGHAYIAARNLQQGVKRIQQNAADIEQAVLNIINK